MHTPRLGTPAASRALAFALLLAQILTVPIVLSARAEEKSAPAKPASENKLPSAKEVIAKFVAAIGGRDSLLQPRSQFIKGSYEMPAQGIKAPLEVSAAKPNLMLVRISIPGFGDVLSGYDGKVGWSLNAATGPMLLEGRQLDQLKDQADFLSPLHEEKNFKTMEVVEQTDFEGKPCYKVRLVRQSGHESIEFFDVKTGLLVGMIAEQETPMGKMSVTSSLADYKKFGGTLYATRTVQKVGAFEQIVTIDSIEFDKVKPSVFGLPDSIQALLKPAPADAPPPKPAEAK